MNLTPMRRNVEAKKNTVSIYLSMSVYAYPAPTIVWYKGNSPVDLTDRHYEVKYVIHKLLWNENLIKQYINIGNNDNN